jgi:Domain of unknown function (DUF4258)
MSSTLEQIQQLVRQNKVRVSDHAYDELVDDGLSGLEVINGVGRAKVVEDYPSFAKGPCVLVLQSDASGSPIHALWGIQAGSAEPAVLITCYRPDPRRWTPDFLRRV